MSNIHRIQWFDQQIRSGNYPNSNVLSVKFEISRRQAQRDIEYMEVSLGAPLVYIAQKRGYCYEDHTYVLPFLYMTEEEKQVLKYLARRYRQYNYENAENVKRISRLLERFTDGGEEEPSRGMPIFEANPHLIQINDLLSHAIEERLVVQMVYSDLGETIHLQVNPLQLVSRYHADYLKAFCEQRQTDIWFRIDCIKDVMLTSEHFERVSLGPIDAAITTLIRKPFVAQVVLNKQPSGKSWQGYPIREIKDNVYYIEFYDIDMFMRHLLFADWEALLSPKWLKVKLEQVSNHMMERLR